MANDITNQLFDQVQKRNIDDVKRILRETDVKVNCLDKHGMTPLQHAAYKGDKELCKILLDHGADVNSNHHDHGYTTLMFAALSGNVATTLLLLQSGASVTAVNSVGRTAAQMAAFVGNHSCVSIINTFISQESIDYYTKPQGLEIEAKLPSHLSGIVHRFTIRVNIHPVGIALFLQQHPQILEHGLQVVRVIQAMSEKEMKRKDTNEVLGFKLHFISYVLEFCHKNTSKGEEREKTLNGIIKVWLKARPSDGFSENLELFIRQGIRQFPYPDSSILQQLVRSLAPVQVGDDPTALSLVSASINGQRMAASDNACATCGETDCEVKKCSSCKNEQYCSQRCQKLHWPLHKQMCPVLAQQWKEAQAAETIESEKNAKE